MHLRRRLHGIAALVLAVAVAAAGCSFIPVYAIPPGFRAATIAPADAWFFNTVTLRPSLSQLAQATMLANAFTSQPGWDRAVEELQVAASGSVDQVDVANDILPLIDGEIAVAVTGTDTLDSPMVVLGLVHSSDPDELLGRIADLADEDRPTPEPGPRGSTLYNPEPDTWVASFRGWLLVSNDRDALDQAIARIDTNASDSLAAQERYTSILSRLPSDGVGLSYVDFRPFTEITKAAAEAEDFGGFSPEMFGDFDVRVATSVAVRSDGLDFYTESIGVPTGSAFTFGAGPDSPYPFASLGEPTSAFLRLPAASLFAYGLTIPPLTEETDAALNDFLQSLAESEGLDSNTPIPTFHPSRWFGGQTALAVDQGSFVGFFGMPGIYLASSVTDPAAAQADLDAILALTPDVTPVPVDVAGRSFWQVPLGDEGEMLTYGISDGWLLATSGSPDAQATSIDVGGLTANPRYAALKGALGNDPVNVFVDLEGIRTIAEEFVSEGTEGEAYDTYARPFVTPLRYLGGGSTTEANGDSHGHFFLGISAQ